jgi:hypothetical protein
LAGVAITGGSSMTACHRSNLFLSAIAMLVCLPLGAETITIRNSDPIALEAALVRPIANPRH